MPSSGMFSCELVQQWHARSWLTEGGERERETESIVIMMLRLFVCLPPLPSAAIRRIVFTPRPYVYIPCIRVHPLIVSFVFKIVVAACFLEDFESLQISPCIPGVMPA